MKLLEQYKTQNISDQNFKDFSENISIALHVDCESSCYETKYEENTEDFAIYMLQTIEIHGKKLNLFYDTGCSDLVCKKNAVEALSKVGRANQILKGPLPISGVGDKTTICEHGLYNVRIPLHNGSEANLSGICLDKITSKFPLYPLEEVEQDIHKTYIAQNGDPKTLPKLPSFIGGDVDLMIGVQYLRYYPEKCFSLPNGLTIYRSQFISSDGHRGIVA